jgi:preprotein translocase subunit SecG
MIPVYAADVPQAGAWAPEALKEFADVLVALYLTLLFITALFLIVLVLIQRGKGGGLAGALGGLGGQSAFGTKAGDLFTRITIGVAFVWIILCMFSIKLLGGGSASVLEDMGGGGGAPGGKAAATAPAPATKPGENAPAPAEKSTGGTSTPPANPVAPGK